MTILYIDDDQEDLELFREALNEIDPAIRCKTSMDGNEAILLTPANCPDFVFLDFKMPATSGGEILRRMQSNRCHGETKIVMYSQFMSDQDMEECLELGVHVCMTKSSSFTLMCNELRGVLF